MSNFSFSSSSGEYRDPSLGAVSSFTLTHRNLLVFERPIESNNSRIVRLPSNTIRVSDHFYSTGEEIEYQYFTENGHIPIGIETSTINGISTSYLPKKLYVIKLSNLDIRVSATAEDALAIPPRPLNLNSLGIGQHKFISKNQNKKCLVALDNVIQSPIIFTGISDNVENNIGTIDTIFEVNDISKFKSGDIIKIDDEYMRIFSVGIGITSGNSNDNRIKVERPILGTVLERHSIGSTINKMQGNYNIIENIIYFADSPYGNELSRIDQNISGSDLEYTNLDSRSRFNGRVFLRSGVPFGNEEAYEKNYLFDSLSDYFDGYKNSFTLTSNNENISGFSTDNAIILINDIMQVPSRNVGSVIENNFSIEENTGISSITFVGNETSISYDVNTSQLPRGGIIFSVKSNEGLGYQSIVSAGGTAIVSTSGTIQSISIGNSGSGYRSGIQTSIKVGVRTESNSIEYIGEALIQNGNVVSVSITNPGIGYTSSNPPKVIFDDPLSYWNIPLKYSSSSNLGVGTEATIDIVVGQKTNIINFDIKNLGYGYKTGEILTVDIGGQSGIPTDLSVDFEEFQIHVTEIKNDEFNGWSLGQLQVIDDINSLFDGERKVFPLSINGERTSIRSRIGSDIDVTANLIVTINNVLQSPKKSYNIRGGSLISFSEPPDSEDKCKILFYKGTIDVDTKNRNILETIKEGDNVRIYDDIDENLDQEFRAVEEILSSDIIRTNIYGNKGISRNENLRRPLIWCRQTEDKFINGKEVTKDRIIYEPSIFPETYLIQPVSTSSTEFFVENVKTFFDSSNEYEFSEDFQDKILLLSQKNTRPAIASPIVSEDGTINNIEIIDSGFGYTTSPNISISSPVGTGEQCVAFTDINEDGEIISIEISNPGFGYTSTKQPSAIIDHPTFTYEIIDDIFYEGDFGSIVGVGTTVIEESFGLTFDLLIPVDSYIRQQNFNRVGVASTGISSIKTNYYFKISNSNIGNNINSLSVTNSSIGISNNFMDNVYQVYDYSVNLKNIIGIGNTYVNTVKVKVQNYGGIVEESTSNYFGDYSWGKISTPRRISPKDFDFNPIEIESSTIVRRYNPLKYLNYFA
jgi:hypothetical protein